MEVLNLSLPLICWQWPLDTVIQGVPRSQSTYAQTINDRFDTRRHVQSPCHGIDGRILDWAVRERLGLQSHLVESC